MACGSVFIERYNKEKAIEAISDAVDQIKTKRVRKYESLFRYNTVISVAGEGVDVSRRY